MVPGVNYDGKRLGNLLVSIPLTAIMAFPDPWLAIAPPVAAMTYSEKNACRPYP